jgi:hypothetical protein
MAQENYVPVYKNRAPEGKQDAADEEYVNIIIDLVILMGTSHKMITVL